MQRVVEKKPPFGSVFLVKYSFDNQNWSQFWAEQANENGNLITFKGCRVKMAHTDQISGSSRPFSSYIPDMQLDGTQARTLGLVVKKPDWFNTTEDDAIEYCSGQDGLFNNLPSSVFA